MQYDKDTCKPRYTVKNVSHATSSTTNNARNSLGSSSGICGETDGLAVVRLQYCRDLCKKDSVRRPSLLTALK